jgi:CubicO group peptidase (beta-lactamase class C family)
MKSLCKIAGGCLLLIFFGTCFSYGQNNNDAFRLDEYMQAAAKMGFNGNVLVADNGNIIYRKAFGYSNLDTKHVLDNNSAFTIASVSKQFTAMGIMLLKQQGKLKLSDTLRQYFPQLPYQNISIENMLDHTSGLPEYFTLMANNWDYTKTAYNGNLIHVLMITQPAVFFKPGQRYRYSNTGYVLLASIIEKVSGLSYDDFMHKYIFGPLKMNSSRAEHSKSDFDGKNPGYAYGFSYSDSLKKFVPSQTIKAFRLVDYLSGIVGDGCIITTTGDLLKWDRAIKNNTLLNEVNQRNMLAPHVLLDTALNTFYGYGVSTGSNELGDYIVHEGIWPGYRACLTRYVKSDITVVVLSNNESNAVGVSRALSFIMYNKDVIAPYRHIAIPIDTAKIKPFLGTYLTPAPVDIIFRDGKLYRHKPGTRDVELKQESATKFFYADLTDRQIEFQVDSVGYVIKTFLISNGVKTELFKE